MCIGFIVQFCQSAAIQGFLVAYSVSYSVECWGVIMQYLKILLAVHSVECLTTCVLNYNLIKI